MAKQGVKMSKIDSIIQEINKKHKAEIIKRGIKYEQTKRINFSSPRANWMLRGGIPVGRITEFAGLESSGKTSTALDIVSNFQATCDELNAPKEVLYVDAEYTLDGVWAQKLGVDIDSIYVDQPDTLCAEDVLQKIEDLAETGEFGLIILDSLAALVPKDKMERDYCDSDKPGGLSQLWTRFVNKFSKIQNKHKFTFIVMNRPKPSIGGYPGQVYYPGGVDWRLACSVRILFERGDSIDIDGKTQPKSFAFPIGHEVKMKLNKTKICSPDRKVAYYTLISHDSEDDGIDIVYDTLKAAEEDLELIEKAGSWYNLPNGEKVQGFKNLKEFYKENDDEFMSLYEQVMEVYKL